MTIALPHHALHRLERWWGPNSRGCWKTACRGRAYTVLLCKGRSSAVAAGSSAAGRTHHTIAPKAIEAPSLAGLDFTGPRDAQFAAEPSAAVRRIDKKPGREARSKKPVARSQ